jgi:hypothetical protein
LCRVVIQKIIIMRSLLFWNRLSNISAILGILILILLRFFDDYIKNIIPFLVLGCLTIIFYLLSEIMKFILKKKTK